MKHWISCFLSISLLASALGMAACASRGGNGDQTQMTGDKKGAFLDNLPVELSFAELSDEERTVTFAYVEGPNGDYTKRSILVEDLTGDAVDAAIFQRNQTVEQRLGVKIEAIEVGTSAKALTSAVTASLSAGDPDYDVIAGYQYYDLGLASTGFLLNINSLDQLGADYIDYNADYWSTDYINAISYNDCVYWLTGDLSLRYLSGMYCTFVNSRIYEQSLQSKYGNLYELVKGGKWTLDMLNVMAADCYKDINGNDTTDEEDQLGLVIEVKHDMSDAMAIGSGCTFSKKNADGSVTLTLGEERTFDFLSKYVDIINSEYFYGPPSSDSVNQMLLFAGGSVAFTVNKLFQSESYLRDMTDDFYIIPVPKYDETQSNYVSAIHDGCTIFGLTYCSDSTAASAATLEALAAESARTVTPEYYDLALKYKYTRDDGAAEMIELIHDTPFSDFVYAWSDSLNEVGHFFRMYQTKSASSAYKKMASAVNVKLEELINSLENYAKPE